MKSNLVFFAGLFFGLGASYLGIVVGSNAQLGPLAPYYDDSDGTTYPQWFPGVAARGQLVYRDLGCAACHTQQVRRPGFGSDQARGWGERQSVARDYIYQPSPQLGLSRIGPDLANLADRKPSAPDKDDLLHLLYAGSGGMPPYRFLFEMREVGKGAQPSDEALKLTGPLEPRAGWQVVPTQRALDLVGYLTNLKTTYDYPEAVPFNPAPKAEGAAPAPAGAKPEAAPAPKPAAAASPAPAAPAPSEAKPAPGAGARPAAPTSAAPAAPTPPEASLGPGAGSAPPAPAPTPTPVPTGQGGPR